MYDVCMGLCTCTYMYMHVHVHVCTYVITMRNLLNVECVIHCKVSCVCSHEMLDSLVVWLTYVSIMYVRTLLINKICMDYLKKGYNFQ